MLKNGRKYTAVYLTAVFVKPLILISVIDGKMCQHLEWILEKSRKTRHFFHSLCSEHPPCVLQAMMTHFIHLYHVLSMIFMVSEQQHWAEQANMMEIMSSSCTTFIFLHRETVMCSVMKFTLDII